MGEFTQVRVAGERFYRTLRENGVPEKKAREDMRRARSRLDRNIRAGRVKLPKE